MSNFTSCSNEDDELLHYNIVTYVQKVMIDENYYFNDEALNRPYIIKISPASGEMIIADRGNRCLYVFSKQDTFTFINKIGRPGQGPGEFLSIGSMDVDNQGDIYVLDNNNMRLTIFSKDGKYLHSFRVGSTSTSTSIFVTSNQNILINSPKNGYYITIYNKFGEKLKVIGNVSHYFEDKYNRHNERYAEGFPLKIDDKYYIFFKHMPYSKIYDKDGNLISENSLLNVLGINSKTEYIPKNGKIKFSPYIPVFFDNADFYNENIYLITRPYRSKITNNFRCPIFVLSKELKIQKEIELPLNENDRILKSTGLILYFEIINNEESVLLPMHDASKILIYSVK